MCKYAERCGDRGPVTIPGHDFVFKSFPVKVVYLWISIRIVSTHLPTRCSKAFTCTREVDLVLPQRTRSKFCTCTTAEVLVSAINFMEPSVEKHTMTTNDLNALSWCSFVRKLDNIRSVSILVYVNNKFDGVLLLCRTSLRGASLAILCVRSLKHQKTVSIMANLLHECLPWRRLEDKVADFIINSGINTLQVLHLNVQNWKAKWIFNQMLGRWRLLPLPLPFPENGNAPKWHHYLLSPHIIGHIHHYDVPEMVVSWETVRIFPHVFVCSRMFCLFSKNNSTLCAARLEILPVPQVSRVVPNLLHPCAETTGVLCCLETSILRTCCHLMMCMVSHIKTCVVLPAADQRWITYPQTSIAWVLNRMKLKNIFMPCVPKRIPSNFI